MRKPAHSRDMDAAHQDGRELLLLVPTGEEAAPLTQEVGWWDDELDRWEGDWRYYDGEGGYADSEPIAWANLPPIDPWFFAKYAKRKAEPATPPPKPKAVGKAVALPKAATAGKDAAKAAKSPPPPKPKPADLRPAKGKHGVDMTTGRPAASTKRTPTIPDSEFDGP